MCSLRVAVVHIASNGAEYEAMKVAQIRHALSAPSSVHVVSFFLHDEPPRVRASWPCVDVVFDRPETPRPGMLNKTLDGLRLVLRRDFDFVVRTNLSTVMHWDKLAAFLVTAPRRDLFAGLLGDDPGIVHLCGCFLVMSADVARRLSTADDLRDREDENEDVLISRKLLPPDLDVVNPARHHNVPRMEICGDEPIRAASAPTPDFPDVAAAVHAAPVLRVKGPDRAVDARIIDDVVTLYAAGVRDWVHPIAAALDARAAAPLAVSPDRRDAVLQRSWA